MRHRTVTGRGWLAPAFSLLLCACIPPQEATREGGTPCSSTDQCNAGGQACGEIHLCVLGFCTETRVNRACPDGGYPDAAMAGDCLDFTDCNDAPRCGSVVNCVNFMCDREGERIEVPCDDGGAADGDDAAEDAAEDGDGPDGAADVSASDAAADGLTVDVPVD